MIYKRFHWTSKNNVNIADFSARHSVLGKKQRGMVLILVLMIFALASIVASELSYQSHREVRRTGNILHRDEAYLFAKGGEVFAIQKLILDYQKDKSSKQPVDSLIESWALESSPYEVDKKNLAEGSLEDELNIDVSLNNEDKEQPDKFEGIGELRIIIEDLQGRFNVNNVRFNNSGHTSGYRQFENVLSAVMVGSPASLSAGLIQVPGQSGQVGSNSLDIPPVDLALALFDWIDLDSDSRMALGSEDGFYEQLKTPYRTPGEDVVHVSELMAVHGFQQNRFQFYKMLMPQRLVSEMYLTEESAEEESEDGEETDESELDLNIGFNDPQPNAGSPQYDPQGNPILLSAAESYWGGVNQYLSALPHPSTINVNTASEEVLQALFTRSDAAVIVQSRQAAPYRKIDHIFDNLDNFDNKKKNKVRPYLSVDSEYFLATIIATIDETKFTLQSKLYRDRTGRVRVIARDFTY